MWINQTPNDAYWLRVSERGPDYRLSENFRLREAQCKDGSDLVLIHPAAVDLAQHLRDMFGPVRISSWYRTVEHNRAIGGAHNSKHTMGMAFDWYPLTRDLEEVQAIVKKMPIGGVGLYEGFTHCDVFGKGRRWDG